MWLAAKQAGVKTFVGFNNLKCPTTILARRLIDEGQIGDVIRFRGTYDQGFYSDPSFPYSWRLDKRKAGSGAIGDLGAHVISIAVSLVGNIDEVCAQSKIVFHKRPVPARDVGYRSQAGDDAFDMAEVDTDDQTQCLVAFRDGAAEVIESSRVAAGRIGYITWAIGGTEGTIYCDGERMNELQFHKVDTAPEQQGFRVIPADAGIPQYQGFFDTGSGGLGFYDMKTIEAYDLVTCMAGEANCFPNFEFGWKVCRVIDAMLLSAKEKRWVTVASVN